MKRFGLAPDNHSCLTLPVDVACLSLDISVMPIPVKTNPELFSRAFWVLPETGIAELVDRDNLGWGQWRTIYVLSISAWRQQGGALWTDRHGDYSWTRLQLLDMLERLMNQWVAYPVLTTVWVKKGSHQTLGDNFCKILTDFKNSSTDRLSRKFAMQRYVDIPPHLTYGSTLPCETWITKKSTKFTVFQKNQATKLWLIVIL